MNKTTLEIMGYQLDVLSLARSSMTCKLWKTAFGKHPMWQVYYGERVADKQADYRILYGERFNRSCLLIQKTWKTRKITIPYDTLLLFNRVTRCFKVNEKIAFVANNQLYIIPPPKVIPLPGEIEDLYDPFEDCGFLYLMTKNGKIIRWKKNEFPNSPEEVYQSKKTIERCQVKNGVFYISECERPYEALPSNLRAIENGKVLWETNLKCGIKQNIQVNDYIGGALGAFHTSDLYLWDTKEKTEARVIVSGVKQFALLRNEAICLTDSGIYAYGLNHKREIERNETHTNQILLVDTDRDEFFVLTSSYIISSHGRKDFKEHLVITDAKVFNGLIYATNQYSCLLLIDPKKGKVIRQGNERVFVNPCFNVYNGMVLGADDNHGIILEPGKLNAIRKIK